MGEVEEKMRWQRRRRWRQWRQLSRPGAAESAKGGVSLSGAVRDSFHDRINKARPSFFVAAAHQHGGGSPDRPVIWGVCGRSGGISGPLARSRAAVGNATRPTAGRSAGRIEPREVVKKSHGRHRQFEALAKRDQKHENPNKNGLWTS